MKRSAVYYAPRPAKRRRTSAISRRRAYRVPGRSTRSAFRYKRPYYRRFYKKRVGSHHRPIKSRYPSRTPYQTGIKSHKECRESQLVVDSITPFNPTSTGVAHRVNHAIMIAPESSGSNDRTVEGNKALYLGANLDFRFKSRSVNINCVVRCTVVELVTQTWRPSGTVDLTASLLDGFYKNENVGSDDESFINYATAIMLDREHFAINEAKFRVLKQQYISLGNAGSGTDAVGPATQSSSVGRFRCYIPMNRTLDGDYTAAFNQEDSNGTSLVTVNRSAYEKPIVLLIEYMFPPGTESAADSILVSYHYCIKHSFKDNI